MTAPSKPGERKGARGVRHHSPAVIDLIAVHVDNERRRCLHVGRVIVIDSRHLRDLHTELPRFVRKRAPDLRNPLPFFRGDRLKICRPNA